MSLVLLPAVPPSSTAPGLLSLQAYAPPCATLHPAAACTCRHITDHRQALENAIFDKGTEALASAMCISLFNLCNPHNLMDSGEL